jgi:hypothetical protein
MELKELLNGFDDMKTLGKGIHGAYSYKCIEVCDVKLNLATNLDNCIVKFQTYKGLIELWTSILCLKLVLIEWHSRQCLMGDCNSCGIHTLKLWPFELKIDKTIHW